MQWMSRGRAGKTIHVADGIEANNQNNLLVDFPQFCMDLVYDNPSRLPLGTSVWSC